MSHSQRFNGVKQNASASPLKLVGCTHGGRVEAKFSPEGLEIGRCNIGALKFYNYNKEPGTPK